MAKRNLLLLLLLFCLSCSMHVIAQTDYYYDHGNKISLTLNEDRVCVSIPKDCEEISKRIRANVQVLLSIKDESLDIFVISRSDLEMISTQDAWEGDAQNVIITSSYYTENGDEVIATPYLNVRLKNEQDTGLLTAFVEDFRLRVAGKSAFMPWYILATTAESGKSPLECANELWESGLFAASVPDFASYDLGSKTAIRSITPTAKEDSSRFYDLQGRHLNGMPQKGMYIRDGKKVMVK